MSPSPDDATSSLCAFALSLSPHCLRKRSLPPGPSKRVPAAVIGYTWAVPRDIDLYLATIVEVSRPLKGNAPLPALLFTFILMLL